MGLNDHEENVARYYDDTIFGAEVARLTADSPIEYAITARHLERLIPEASVVAEIGVGGGLYTELLARRRCFLHLVDISQRLLDWVATRLREDGLAGRLLAATRASATNLGMLPEGIFDAVLLLGPLYHLPSIADRERAVHEARRLLRPGGLLFAAGINRLAYLREQFRQSPEEVIPRRVFHQQFLIDGNLDPTHAPPIGFAHLSTFAEFASLFPKHFETLLLTGVESFTAPWQMSFSNLACEVQEAWLELIEQTGATPEGVAHSDHFLFVGRARQ
jgi:SAM-dependent methyltransferase